MSPAPASLSVGDALARACALARRGRGDVEPNPVVGATVLVGDRVVGEGWHRAWGGPHAEVEALRAAGEHARGATLCVTLEPCSTTGKTPACTDAIVRAGIARVVVGCPDPNPVHQGHGIERLLAAGVEVDLTDHAEAHALVAGFPAQLARRRPHVLAKWAMSRDGAIAPPRGGQASLSGPESHALVHRWRAHLDAILVGVNTVIADDPQLTARGDEPRARPLRRVVLDPSLRTPPTCRLARTADEAPTWIYAADDAPEPAEDLLVEQGVMVIRMARGERWLPSVFEHLHLQGCGRVMVEGGSHTLARCLAADVVDQAAVFMVPAALGEGALPAVNGLRLGRLSPFEVATALKLHDCRVTPCGEDTLVRGFRDTAAT
ncbi:MAG: bifunctional diaminohydroxyphosphoribosylaminopyrimidine deaminase/5-amino-6-(5-phosphoribosylamino)uracil reductase RibD [Planctomycetota bacterium]|jgi:diaminohydroxyphosphoribosylaminopyrimidine deaminase/5-amino-6-(5-phosphoribosylamino)uracil reductase